MVHPTRESHLHRALQQAQEAPASPASSPITRLLRILRLVAHFFQVCFLLSAEGDEKLKVMRKTLSTVVQFHRLEHGVVAVPVPEEWSPVCPWSVEGKVWHTRILPGTYNKPGRDALFVLHHLQQVNSGLKKVSHVIHDCWQVQL